jgi:hypothetical protein
VLPLEYLQAFSNVKAPLRELGKMSADLDQTAVHGLLFAFRRRFHFGFDFVQDGLAIQASSVTFKDLGDQQIASSCLRTSSNLMAAVFILHGLPTKQ